MLQKVCRALSLIVVLLAVIWATEWLAPFRSLVTADQFAVAMLSLSLAIVFISQDQKLSAQLSVCLAVLSVCTGMIAIYGLDNFALRMFLGDIDLTALSAALIALTLFACYLVTGVPMTLLVLGFLVFGIFARYLPQPITAPPFDIDTYVVYVAFGGDALVGQALRIVTAIVVVFIFFSRMFELMGGAKFFSYLAELASGRGPGGPLKVAVIASALFGSVNGSTTANVVSSGGFSIPMMRSIGVLPHQAAAIEAVASTGGQLMPPIMGVAAFLMVEIAGVPYSEVISAACFPALLYFVSIFFQIDGLATRSKLPLTDPTPIDWGFLLHESLRTLIPLSLILGTLIIMPYAPSQGAVFGSTACILLATTRLTRHEFKKQIIRLTTLAGQSAAQIVVVGAVIGMLLGVVNYTGLGVAGALAIKSLTADQLAPALLAAAVACFFLGLGLATTAVYAIVGTLIAPSLIELGLPVISAHLFVFYSAMLSMITPPVAIACLAASGIAGAPFWRTAFSALRLGWILFFLPFLFVLNPELLLIGSTWHVAVIVPCCVLGIAGLSTVVGRLPVHYSRFPQVIGITLMSVISIMPAVPDLARLMTASCLAIIIYRDSRRYRSTMCDRRSSTQ